jgi:hypothetical protein
MGHHNLTANPLVVEKPTVGNDDKPKPEGK